MMDFDLLRTFMIAAFIIELTPGPNMGYLAVVTLQKGRRSAFAVVAGVALGLAVVGLAAASGLALLISQNPYLYQTLRWTGVFYLFWLAWEGWWPEREEAEKEDAFKSNLKFFRRGLITNLLNPKAAVFYIAILPTFISPSAQDLEWQFVILATVYVIIATVIHVGVVTLASAACKVLLHPARMMIVRRVLSSLLVLIGLWMLWKTRS